MKTRQSLIFRKLITGQCLRITKEIFPELNSLIQNVIAKLHYNKPLECYIVNDAETSATSINLEFYNQPNVIVFSSQLINNYDDREIEFIIGHEIGHLIIDVNNLSMVRNFLLENDDKEAVSERHISLNNHLQYLDNLIELSADRFGLISCDNIDTAVSTLFKLHSGIDIKKRRLNSSQFFKKSSKSFYENIISISENLLSNNLASTSFRNDEHPIYPIRILSLKYFSESKFFSKFRIIKNVKDKTLEKQVESLCIKLREFGLDSFSESMPYYIASAGLLVANLDGEISDKEIDVVNNYLSYHTLFPEAIIKEVHESGKIQDIFEKTHNEIVEKNPELMNEMFYVLIEFALSDGFLHDKEKEFLFDVGEKLVWL